MAWTDLWVLEAPGHFQSLVMHLLENSNRPFETTTESTLQMFIGQFCGNKSRLETLGLFLAAVSRATVDISFFPPLYTTEDSRFALQSITTRLNDRLVELCLSLDRLNDLQLILQFEHFVVHSNVSGDQSGCYVQKASTDANVVTRLTLLALSRRCNGICFCPGIP